MPELFISYTDLLIHIYFLFIAVRSAIRYLKPSVLAFFSLLLLLVGNVLYLYPKLIYPGQDYFYSFYLNLAGLEVIVFAISIAYRNYYLKKQHENALSKTIIALKASEELKESINIEIERKVAERTQQVEEMNELLQKHNIKLTSEVKNANEARAFHKKMNFVDFQQIFPDEESCLKYLSKLKWKPNETVRCRKCNYEKNTVLTNLSIRCGKCTYVESVTYGTLFQNVKFSILKAFYNTYSTSNNIDESKTTIAELAKEIDLRQATIWAFKNKILSLMEVNKTKKKHKDGWTHLIEYSITK